MSIDAQQLSNQISPYFYNPTLEHYWIGLSGDDTIKEKMCARCEAQYPTDAPCIDAPLSPGISEAQIVQSIALLAGISEDEARAGLTSFVDGLIRKRVSR